MEGNLGLVGIAGNGDGGGRASSSGSTCGPSSTAYKVASEESSSYPDESEVELGLGLSLGGGVKSKSGQVSRIWTAEDFSSMGFKSPSSLSSSSSSNFSAGIKRTADSVLPPSNAGARQVVGWPPVGSHRMNSLANQAKSPAMEDQPTGEKSKSKNLLVSMVDNVNAKYNHDVKKNRQVKASLFVKVNMDGDPIGRKVDLNTQNCYKTLAQTLENMFDRSTATVATGARPLGSSVQEYNLRKGSTGSLKLLDGSAEFVLTYEDKEGDWMLVGDVPWGMFLGTVKRLRIMRTSEANGLGPRCQERGARCQERGARQ